MTTTATPITPKQRNFLERLLDDRNLDHTDLDADEIRGSLDDLSVRDASNLIDRLRNLPPRPSGVPDGRYAIQVDGSWLLYRLRTPDHGRWAGWQFVDRQISDNWQGVKDRANRDAVLAAIREVGPEAASAEYGRRVGVCGVCGRALTDQESVERGIGPVCADRMGWT